MLDLYFEDYLISKIVLLDDDPVTLFLNSKIIKYSIGDILVYEFTDVDEAIEFLKKSNDNSEILIFLDINMPNKNGFDFLEEHLELELGSKVVMLSSSILSHEKQKAFSYNSVIDFISKPLSMDFLKMKFVKKKVEMLYKKQV